MQGEGDGVPRGVGDGGAAVVERLAEAEGPVARGGFGHGQVGAVVTAVDERAGVAAVRAEGVEHEGLTGGGRDADDLLAREVGGRDLGDLTDDADAADGVRPAERVRGETVGRAVVQPVADDAAERDALLRAGRRREGERQSRGHTHT